MQVEPKNIKVKVTSNKKVVALHVSEYKNIINDLRQEIEELKAKIPDTTSHFCAKSTSL